MSSYFANPLNPLQNPHSFHPSTSIPPLTHQTILVTGGNAGVGLESIRQLLPRRPERIYLAARTQAKYDNAITSLAEGTNATSVKAVVRFLELDLADFDSIKRAAEQVLRDSERLDILMCNAGVMALPPGLTKQGYEVQFGTNHMGHALLVKLLVPLLERTVEHGHGARIIVLSSAAEGLAPRASGINFPALTTTMESYHTYTRYAQSKLANIMFVKELARRHNGVTSVAVHPGRVRTQLLDTFNEKKSWVGWAQGVYDGLCMMGVEKGAWSQVWAATAEIDTETGDKKKGCSGGAGAGVVRSGDYYWPVGVATKGSKWARDGDLARRLWEWQEDEFRKHGC